MSILSFEFLIFILVILVLYYLLPVKVRWLVLFSGSVFFLFWAGWWSLFYLTLVSLLVWLGAHLLEKRKQMLFPLLILIFGSMIFVKYAANLIWSDVSVIGLSYFTFQAVSFLIDVYHGKVQAQKNPLRVWLFVGYFPQMVQGPISTWKDIGKTLYAGHSFEEEKFVSGFILLLWGYFKKLVIADRISQVTKLLNETDGNLQGRLIVCLVILYSIRLYTDFSGGVDVVRGLSRMLGIELPENFARPFFADSIAEYWRRWHITLGAWFRNYLMYPFTISSFGIAIGKKASRVFGKKMGRMIPSAISVIMVFLLIGIWHNFSANALIYGLYFGLIIAFSMLMEPQWKKLNKKFNLKDQKWLKVLRIVRTWLLLLPSQYFAFTTSPKLSLSLMKRSFLTGFVSGTKMELTAIMSLRQWKVLGIALLLLFTVDLIHEKKGELTIKLVKAPLILRWGCMLLLILGILVFGIYGEGIDSAEFLYTTF